MPQGLDWRWIGIGVAIMFGLNFVATLLIMALFVSAMPTAPASPEEAAAAVGAGRLALAALISVAAYLIGGYIVGLKSRGRTILEPGISAAIAVLIALLIGGGFSLQTLLVGALIPFLAALLGGYLGERRQAARPATP